MSDATTEFHTVTRHDLEPDGMCCACDCGCETCFDYGDLYVTVLTGMVGATPLTEVRCVDCRNHHVRSGR